MKIRLLYHQKWLNNLRMPLKYRLTHPFKAEWWFSKKVLDIRFLCEYGLSLDFRKGTFFDQMLTKSEHETFIKKLKG